MPRRFFLTLSALLLATLAAGPRPAERTTVTIIATTDLHGYILPFDYYANRPANRGLAKAATIIRRLRKEDPHALLIDCGDTIQGSPLVDVHAQQVRRGDPKAG